MTALIQSAPASSARQYRFSWADAGPFLALAALLALGFLINPDFLSPTNLANVITRSAYIAIIAVGATFVISSGALDLSVGSMVAFIAGITIMFMNIMAPSLGVWAIPAGMAVAVVTGLLCGLANGLVVTVGQIEPFIATLGTMGIFRALITYMTNGGTIPIDRSLREAYRPVYFGSLFGIPYPVLITAVVVLAGAFLLTTRGGDFELDIGQDISIGYSSHSATSVELYFFLSFTFRLLTTEASVVLDPEKMKK